MSKQIVNKGGTVLIGSGSGAPSSFYDGTQTRSTSLSKSVTVQQAKACGDTYSQKDVTGEDYEVSATVYYPTDGTGGLFAVGTSAYVTYKTQQTVPVTLFAGSCIVTRIGDSQSDGDYEMQDITFASNGEPDTVIA